MIPFFFACTAKNSVYTNSGSSREIAKKLLDSKPINPDIKDSMGWDYLHWSLSLTEPLTILNDIFSSRSRY